MNLEILRKLYIKPLIILIKLYQFFISPFLKNNCRFMPSCSEYTIESLSEYGFIKGGYMAVKRILHCHPYGGQGYDPVPKKIRKGN